MASGALLGASLYARVTRNLPSIEELPLLMDRRNGELLQPTTLQDRSGLVTLYTYENLKIEQRFLAIDPETSPHISLEFTRLLVASLEPDFWTSPGTALVNWRDPAPMTIAERLVDELLLWNEPPSPTRAVRMRLLAAQAVSRYGKQRVLEWYVNSAWFGQMAYGAETAAQLYLGKSSSELTLAEAAVLIPILETPALNPHSTPETALEARSNFLNSLLENGSIHQQEYTRAMQDQPVFNTPPEVSESPYAGIIHLVETQLENTLGYHGLRRGGLTVVTTLDANLQAEMTCAAIVQLERIQGDGTLVSGEQCDASLLLPTQNFPELSNDRVSAGGLIVNPSTGEILAYLEPVNSAGKTVPQAGYQPGSLLTTLAAVSGFSSGYSPASLVWDIPSQQALSLDLPPAKAYLGPLNLRSALASDALTPLAVLINQLGPARVWKTGVDLGLSSLSTEGDTLSPLYTGAETSLPEIAAMFSTLANNGVRAGVLKPLDAQIELNSVRWVSTVSGRIILENSQPARAVIVSDALAYLVNHVLSDESARWSTLGYPNALEVGSTVAARTGHADNGRQVWTVGYNPQLLTLVWMGSNSEFEDAPALDVRMPAGIWHAIFRYATREGNTPTWTRPISVSETRVCVPSGMLPTAICPDVKSDVFLLGNEPSLPDTLYTRIKVNRETGQRATVFTPLDLVEERVYMNIPEDARQWAGEAGIALAPTGYDTIQSPRVDPQVTINEPPLFSAVSGTVLITGIAAGEDFSSYSVQVGEGINPDTWLQVGQSTNPVLSEGTLVSWDTSGLEGLYAIRLTVLDNKNLIRTALSQVTVDNTPPGVLLRYPAADGEISPVRGGVTLLAEVSDQVGFSRLEWWLDGRLAATQSNPPYAYFLLGTSGTHQVQLKAWDIAGNQAITEKVKFQIAP